MYSWGACSVSLTTQFVFGWVFDLQGLRAGYCCVFETVFRCAPLDLIDLFRNASTAEWVADRHCDQALRVKRGGTRTEWGFRGWCRRIAG